MRLAFAVGASATHAAQASLYTAGQEASLRSWAAAATFDESKCSGLDEPLTDTERVYSSEAPLKYFAYDTKASASWAPLQDLQTCLEGVKGFDWLGGHGNLWEANKRSYTNFASVAAKDFWIRQEYLEFNPVKVGDTVIAEGFASTMNSFKNASHELYLQQPCSAFSNAAFYQIALTACSSEGIPDINGWAWETESKAAANLLAFGSFAMHGNPYIGASPPAGYRGPWSPISTVFLDVIGMKAYFYMCHQAAVRRLVSASNSEESITPLLQLGVSNFVKDSRVSVRDLTRILTQNPSTWKEEMDQMSPRLPEYLQSAVGMVLVALRAILHDELFGRSVAVSLYELICSGLVDNLLQGNQAVKDTFCKQSSAWMKALNSVTLLAPKELAASLGSLVGALQVFIEAFFWQETKASPRNYLRQWIDAGVLDPANAECWLHPHATWHRLAALTAQKLTRLIGLEIPTLTQEPPLTNSQKQAAWANTADAAAQFKLFVDTFIGIKKADTINMCRVFKAARACAASSPFCGPPPVRSYLDPEVLNEFITREINKHDPIIENIVSERGPVKDPLNICLFQYELKVDTIRGLSKCFLRDLNVRMAYAEGSTPEGAVIRSTLTASTCPIRISVSGSAMLRRDGYVKDDNWIPDINIGQCERMDTIVNFTAALTFALDAKFSIDADLHSIFAGVGPASTKDPFNAAVQRLDLDCHDITLDPLIINNAKFDSLTGALNGILDLGVTKLACGLLSPELKPAVQKEVDKAVRTIGTRVTTSRRLASSDECRSTTALGAVQAAIASKALTFGRMRPAVILTACVSFFMRHQACCD